MKLMRKIAVIGTLVVAVAPSIMANPRPGKLQPSDPEFDALAASQKQQLLFEETLATEYKDLPQWTGREPLAMFALSLNPIRSMVRKFFNVTLDHSSDVMPEGRKKGIHTYGSTAAIEFVADGESPFTGLYQGKTPGLIRLSLATKPSESAIVPGAAVKFFVDGKPSINIVAMNSLEGQASHNFFTQNFSTFIAPPRGGALKVLAAAFRTATKDPTKVDSSALAATSQDGSLVRQAVAPEQLVLVPNREQLVFDATPHEVREDFATLAPGTRLYEVFGIAAGSTAPVYIGHIDSSSRFVASQFGDERLFFRHLRYQNR
jgi:hypothetical protein